MASDKNTPAKAKAPADDKAKGDDPAVPEAGTPAAAPTDVASADADTVQPLAGDEQAPDPTPPGQMPAAERFGSDDVVTGPPPEMTTPASDDMPFERAVPRDADVEAGRATAARHEELRRSELSRAEIAATDEGRVQVQVRQPVEGEAPFDAHERFQELWARARDSGGTDVRALGGNAIEVSHETYKKLPAKLRKGLEVVGGTDPDAGKE